jgi:general secretion pathway protein H
LIRRRQGGVTLIELLVVLAILALIAGAVALNLPPARSDAKREAERFAALLNAASNESIATGLPLRVEITASGYAFSRYEEREWRAIEAPATLGGRSVRGLTMAAAIEDPAMKNEEADEAAIDDSVRRITLDPIGATAPFAVDFSNQGERWRVVRGADGSIEIENVRS